MLAIAHDDARRIVVGVRLAVNERQVLNGRSACGVGNKARPAATGNTEVLDLRAAR